MPPQRDEERHSRERLCDGGGVKAEYATIHVDQFPDIEVLPAAGRAGAAVRRESFIAEFAKSKGPPQIVILVILVALGFGSTIGVVRTGRTIIRRFVRTLSRVKDDAMLMAFLPSVTFVYRYPRS